MDIKKYEPGTPCWVELETTDTRAAKAFYGELFGWSYDDMPIPGGGVYTMARLRGKDVAAITPQMQASKAAGAPPHWNTYVLVADVALTTGKVSKLGGQVLAGPFDVMDAGKMSAIRNPGGAHLMLWQAGKHAGAAVANEQGAWTWSELYTHDVEGAEKFYAGLLGWTAKPGARDMPVMLENRGRAVANAMAIRKEGGPVPPHWAVYFFVTDCDATAKRVAQLGGKGVVPPTDAPGMRIAGFDDPQGSGFMIVQTTA